MKKMLLLGISATLLIPLAPLIDWHYYNDRRHFIMPISYSGKSHVRKDSYGAGYFGAPRRGRRMHKGLDIEAPMHSEVVASKGGRAQIGFQSKGMGKFIIINHA